MVIWTKRTLFKSIFRWCIFHSLNPIIKGFWVYKVWIEVRLGFWEKLRNVTVRKKCTVKNAILICNMNGKAV